MTAEKDDKWVMPKPVFRSTPGALPKSLQKTISGYNMPRVQGSVDHSDVDPDDDILSVMDPPRGDGHVSQAAVASAEAVAETAPPESPSAAEPHVDPFAETMRSDEADTEEFPTSERIKVTAAAPKPPKKRGIGSFLVIFFLVAAFAAGILYGAMYYLAHRSSTGAP
jgi:hypothetical protein